MNSKAKRKVPQLRFSEFLGCGDWEEKKLGDVATKVNSGKTPLGGESAYSESGILFIRSQNIISNKLVLSNTTFISESINKNMKNSIVKSKDILLNITGASLGRSCVVPKSFDVGNVNQHVCIIRLKENYEPFFIQPILSSEKGQNILVSFQTGSGREGLNFQSIRKINIFVPDFKEQTAIAAFLQNLDNRIEKQTQLIEKLKQLKKGYLQKLFPKQGEKVPQMRFREFLGAGDWVEKKLGEIGETYGGLTGKSGNDFLNGKVRYLTYMNIYSNRIINELGDSFVVIYENENQNIVKSFDLFFTTSSETPDEVGFCSTIGNVIEKICLNSFCFGFRLNDTTVNYNIFLTYYFSTKVIRNKIYIMAQGSTRYNLSKKELLKMTFYSPTFEEQTAIADFLQNLDNKIEKSQSILSLHQKEKKAYLQKMFV